MSGNPHPRSTMPPRTAAPPPQPPPQPQAPAAAPGSVAAPLPVPNSPIFEAKVRGESSYDRITSFLMALVIGTGFVVGCLFLAYYTRQAFAAQVTAPLQIVEVFGGGGGSPEGTPGSTEDINVAGAEAADRASNNEEDASEFEEPQLAETPAMMLDAAAEAGESLAEVDIGAVMPSGGPIATGKRASKLGTGGPGLGFGPGDGGVRREERWSIIYNPGQTLDEYARQLDALGVELGAVQGGQMVYARNFSNPTPAKRTGSGQNEKRLYFVWQGGARKASDVALLRKAGINVGEGAIFQFYPPNVESMLSQLEVRYKGRQPGEIRKTRFSVVARGSSYSFVVLSQETLR